MTTGKINTVAEVLKTTMTVMKDQQKQQIKEQQEQREQQREQFEQQLKVLKSVSRGQRSEVDRRSSKPTIASLGLQLLTDDEEIEDYFIAFERSMRFNEIEKDQLMRTPHLKGKALSQYNAQDEDSDYDEVKLAIRRRFAVNAETYRQRLRATKLKTGDDVTDKFIL